ncbi:MAG: acyltransferase family protein [Blastocatellia bacterium]
MIEQTELSRNVLPDAAARTASQAPTREAGAARLAGRLVSLDVFRGLTIAAMVLVNNPGNGNFVYWPLRHAAWHGWTPTDLIFPFFLFIVGVAIPMAFQRRVEQGGNQRDLYLKIFRRSLLIFLIGLLALHWFPYTLDKLSRIRIPGVLQRIALCYLFASVIFLKFRARGQAIIAAALLLGYWLAMKTIAAPGYPADDLSLEGSLASWIDRTLLPGHIYRPMYDPEGLFSTLPAIVTCLSGVWTGQWLMSKREPLDKAAGMFGVGALCLIVGGIWDLAFPINKPLWTSSYVVFTTGFALQLLALCYWAIDLKGWRGWTKPFVILGVNALALFVFSGLMARLMGLVSLPRLDGAPGTLQTFLYDRFLVLGFSPINASLGYALGFVLLWLGLMTILYRRGIFIKV